jgi:hypothetical protein
MKKITTILIVLALAGNLQATIVCIPANYPTIQQGIGAVGPGDTVLVYPGTYPEEINFMGNPLQWLPYISQPRIQAISRRRS